MIPGLSPNSVNALKRLLANGVSTVFGRAGDVVATLGDYAASLVTNDSSVTGATVKDALDGLLAAIPTAASQLTNDSSVSGATVKDALNSNLTALTDRPKNMNSSSQVGIDFGVAIGTTNASGVLTVNHNLGVTPKAVVATESGTAAGQWVVVNSITSTSFTLTFWNTAGTVNNTLRDAQWIAIG